MNRQPCYGYFDVLVVNSVGFGIFLDAGTMIEGLHRSLKRKHANMLAFLFEASDTCSPQSSSVRWSFDSMTELTWNRTSWTYA